MKLWGKDHTRRELEALTGDLRQIADIELQTLADGPGTGVRVATVRTGGGLEFPVLLDRGMDLGHATYKGIPLTWHSPVGATHPHRAETSGAGWLRTFPGGLLSLCGLTNIGPPSLDVVNGEEIGLHGRISQAQARRVSTDSQWSGDEWMLTLRGVVEEAALFRHKLSLERTIEVVPGVPGFRLTDRVRNFGASPAPLMLLYHCNFGWPLLSASSRVTSPATKVEPRDAAAAPGIGQWSSFGEPTVGFQEQVFFHQMPKNAAVAVRLENPHLGIGIQLAFDSAQLDHFTQWKQAGFGDYVLGLEPGNCSPIGQTAALAQQGLPMLEAGETKEFRLDFSCFDL